MTKRGWMMGWMILAIGVGLFVIIAGDAFARSRPEAKFCLRGPTGSNACLYNTLEQCRMAASGTGGSCRRNPRYGARR